jgi:hypothetical protein
MFQPFFELPHFSQNLYTWGKVGHLMVNNRPAGIINISHWKLCITIIDFTFMKILQFSSNKLHRFLCLDLNFNNIAKKFIFCWGFFSLDIWLWLPQVMAQFTPLWGTLIRNIFFISFHRKQYFLFFKNILNVYIK